MTDTAPPAAVAPALPPVNVDEFTMPECADYLTKIRKHMITNGVNSASDDEIANVIRCMRRIRGDSARRGKSSPQVPTVSLDDF